jgi:hypothetical protein
MSLRLQWLGSRILLLVCCSCTHALHAQQGAAPCNLARPVSSDVALKLGLKDGQTVYHEGEIITLELAFTSNAKNRVINTRTYDRSGRLNEEYFCLSPEGRDPLQDYFGSGIYEGFVGGGLGGSQTLSDVPYVIREELNEWRSVPAGRYSLRVLSHRGSVPDLASNEVRFQVIAATPEWQARQLARALVLLDADHKRLTQAEFEQAKHAERVLRFLGSEAATRELARRFWSHDQQGFRPNIHSPGTAYPSYVEYEYQLSVDLSNFEFGLIGSPHRELAIQELVAALHDRQRPATPAMVKTLALLEIMSKPEYQMAPYDNSANEEWKKQWDARRRVRADAYEELVAKLSKEIQ